MSNTIIFISGMVSGMLTIVPYILALKESLSAAQDSADMWHRMYQSAERNVTNLLLEKGRKGDESSTR